jgi:hypothetical protein
VRLGIVLRVAACSLQSAQDKMKERAQNIFDFSDSGTECKPQPVILKVK